MNVVIWQTIHADWNQGFQQLAQDFDPVLGQIMMYSAEAGELAQFIAYLREQRVGMIIPTRFLQYRFLIENYDTLVRHVPHIVCCRTQETLDLLNNKYRFYRFMEEHGLSRFIPQVYLAKTSGQVTRFTDPQFPCIFKLALVRIRSFTTAKNHLIAKKGMII
jgi:hypothetical protein